MNLKKYLYIIILFMPVFIFAQDRWPVINLSTTGLYGSGLYSLGEQLPFWFTANQQGIFEHENGTYQLGEIEIDKTFNAENDLSITYGAYYVYANGATNYQQLNEWYGGIKYKSFYLKAGAFAEETLFDGLSSTNGNIDWSNNARPMPRIRIATDDYISLPFGHNSKFWNDVTFKGIYDEGFLNDDSRYVKNVHLHHKAFFLRKPINSREHVSIGAEHYSMWGGVSPKYGEFPGFKSYLRVILPLPGSPDAPNYDQIYFAGNSLGLFYLDYQKQYPSGTFTMYLNHPWDHVPIIIHNIFDNLIGFNFKLNKQCFISNILVEMINTNDQGGVMHVRDPWDPIQWYERLFRHGEYKSGFSYENRIIAAPFFSPMVIVDGVNYGTGNNRVSLFHAAVQGYFWSNFSWKYFFSYYRNFGTYQGGQAYDAVNPGYFDMGRHKFSQLLEVKYEVPKTGIHLSVAGASDNGHWDNLYGLRFKLEKTFNVK